MLGRLSVSFVFLLVCVLKPIISQTKTAALLAPEGDTLQYVTAVFRHGEHTVDAATAYPLDPYLNETYYPYGIGQLTARGKEREYAIGTLLRKRYDTLLGNIYIADAIDAVTTDMSRTKTSLQLVLAGLYPPKGNIMEWNSKLNWQPIAYRHLDFEKDLAFTISIYFCANYAKEYNAYLSNGEGKKLQDKYSGVYQYLRENTGLNIQRTMEIFFVYSGLQAQSDWGITLPPWTERVFPEVLTQATIDGLASGIATTKLKQLSGGPLAKKIVEAMKTKANNTMEPEDRKLMLYSGHDLNIAYILGALNVFTPHVVPFGACVLIELHKIKDEHFVKVLYEDYTGDEPKTLTVPGCEPLCSLSKFENLIKVNYPEKDEPCGDDVKVLEETKQQKDYYTGKVQYRSLIGYYVKWGVSTAGKVVKGVVDVSHGIFDATVGRVGGAGLNLLTKHKDDNKDTDKDKGIFGKLVRPFGH